VRRAMEVGLLRTADVKTTSKIVWATLHGATSLELDGYFDEAGPASRHQTYQLAVDTLIKGLRRFVS